MAGDKKQACACTACARPISPPQGVTALFNAIFCDLNGATDNLWRAKIRHSAVTKILFPASDVVPCTINVLGAENTNWRPLAVHLYLTASLVAVHYNLRGLAIILAARLLIAVLPFLLMRSDYVPA